MKTHYQDKWRRFIKRALRNVDYLTSEIPEHVVEEISYKMEMIVLQKDEILFESGKPCREIYIVCNGEIEIRITNNLNTVGTYLDSLYSG